MALWIDVSMSMGGWMEDWMDGEMSGLMGCWRDRSDLYGLMH